MVLNSDRIVFKDRDTCSFMFSNCVADRGWIVGVVMDDTLVVDTVCECFGE